MTRNPKDYRPCVGIAVFNEHGAVWLGKRLGHRGPYSWQMPQGGIDKGEDPQDAAYRELFEETGIHPEDVTLLGQTADWLYYDFPESYRSTKARKHKGQRQLWFAFRFHGDEASVDLKAHGPQEFSKWKWANFYKAPKKVIPFKRSVYEQLTIAFADYARSLEKVT